MMLAMNWIIEHIDTAEQAVYKARGFWGRPAFLCAGGARSLLGDRAS
jgi:hypothetical protein